MRRAKDGALRSAGLLVAASGLVLVLGGAYALSTVITRFGTLGLLVFAILMGGWLMFLAPFLMASSELLRAGSARQREAAEARRVAQRLHLGVGGPPASPRANVPPGGDESTPPER